MSNFVKYGDFEFDKTTKSNINYLYQSDSNKLRKTVVSNKLLSLPSGLLNNKKNVLPQIYESLNEMDKKLQLIPLLDSKETEKIERVIHNVSTFIIEESNKKGSILKEQQSIQDKFMKKVHDLEDHLAQIKEASKINWVEKTSPELSELVKSCEESLAQSENNFFELKDRIKFLPTRLGGTSGCYQVPGLGQHLVVKPSTQEGENETPGFPKGTNVIRERMAYSMQKELEIDCGIPPTMITTMAHQMFGENDPISNKLNNFGFPLTRQQFFALAGDGKNLDEFYDNLINFQNEIIKGYTEHESPEIIKEINDYLNNEIDYVSKKVIDANYMLAGQLRGVKGTRTDPQRVKKEADDLLIAMNAGEKGQAGVVSCQLMIPKCRPVNSLSSNKKNKINPKECEKFVIDLILLNTDRHMGNALVQSITKDQLLSRLETKFGLDIHSSDEIIKYVIEMDEFFETKKDNFILVEEITKRLLFINNDLQINDELEKTISNIIFATINQYDFIYELVLIDHGNTMPEPATANNGMHSLDCSSHNWIDELPQSKNIRLTGIAKEKILSLDIMNYVNLISKEASSHERQFGKSCKMDPKCFDILRVNLLCLQRGVAKDFSLNELNMAFARRGPIKTIYEEIELIPLQKRYSVMDSDEMREEIDSKLLENLEKQK
jgi:hypothetical protein